jgi:hypothetical protein
MSQGTTTRREAPAPQPAQKPARRLAAFLPVVAGAAALILFAALAGIAASMAGGGTQVTAASAPASSSPTSSATPTAVWQLSNYRRIGFDKSFKADLIDQLPSPPDLVVFGGSRAMRFSPPYITELTGLSAFNNAVQCFRPEDAWAFSSYLWERSPRLRCVIALQARTLVDDRMRAGLLYDPRLASAFPGDLIAAQRAALGKPERKEVLGENRYTARGYLVHNRYDIARQHGYDFEHHIDVSIARLLPNHSWHGPVRATRAESYFEKTVQLYNQHDVTPLVILMPVQPRALKAFRAAGFQRHLNALTGYLAQAQTRGRFRVLDFTDIRTFGGSAREFYDAVHPTGVNTQRIIRRAVELAPECFE